MEKTLNKEQNKNIRLDFIEGIINRIKSKVIFSIDLTDVRSKSEMHFTIKNRNNKQTQTAAEL